MKRRDRVIISAVLVLIFISSLHSTSAGDWEDYPLAFLTLKTDPGRHFDYAIYVAKYLKSINVKVRIKVEEWGGFGNELIQSNNYDLAVLEIGQKLIGPYGDLRKIYSEDGLLGNFGWIKEFPYCNESEYLLKTIYSTENREEKTDLFNEWMNIIMDKILPVLPLFQSRNYVIHWSNIIGFDIKWGLTDSLPYISIENYHEGQISNKELNLNSLEWEDLNFLKKNKVEDSNFKDYWICKAKEIDNPLSTFVQSLSAIEPILSLISEPILQRSPEMEPIKTGLVLDWEKLNENKFRFYLRDNVFWNPSYNITNRDKNSLPLSTIPSIQLMKGLKGGEYSNGSNQRVTAKDVAFTLLTLANPLVSEGNDYFSLIKNIQIDNTKPLEFNITLEPEFLTWGTIVSQSSNLMNFWPRLNTPILPEFFLNSTNTTLTYSSGGIKTWGLFDGIENTLEWQDYWRSGFGCGKYMLDYHNKGELTSLEKSINWFGVGAKDGVNGLNLTIERINLYTNMDYLEALSTFQNGKLDMIEAIYELISREKIKEDSRFNYQTYLSPSQSYLIFNLHSPLVAGASNFYYLDVPGKEVYTKGVAIRKAIFYSIDREEMNQIFSDGRNRLAHYPVIPTNQTDLYFEHFVELYYYNIEKADEWISMAGYSSWCCVEENPFKINSSLFGMVIIGIISYMGLKKRKII